MTNLVNMQACIKRQGARPLARFEVKAVCIMLLLHLLLSGLQNYRERLTRHLQPLYSH